MKRAVVYIRAARQWQTLIAGALGFAAIVFSLQMEALNRRAEREDAREQSRMNAQILMLNDARTRVASLVYAFPPEFSAFEGELDCINVTTSIPKFIGPGLSLPFETSGTFDTVSSDFLEDYSSLIRTLQVLLVATGNQSVPSCAADPEAQLMMISESIALLRNGLSYLEQTYAYH